MQRDLSMPHRYHEHCLCTVGHMFFSFAAFQLLDVCQSEESLCNNDVCLEDVRLSPKNFSALKEMQALVNHPQLKMIKPSDTRWLAHDRSVKAIRCSMRPLIDTLEHIHEDTGEPEALGMLRTMKTYNFVATLMMLSDVLPVLTCLSRALQAKTADFTLVASQLTYVQHSLQQIKERSNDQEYLSTVHDTVTDLAIGVVDLETARENFNKNVL